MRSQCNENLKRTLEGSQEYREAPKGSQTNLRNFGRIISGLFTAFKISVKS